MKIFKPIMFAVAGFAIAFLVAFKNEEPQVEYATLYYDEIRKINAIQFTTNYEEKYISSEKIKNESILVKTLNELSKDGWKIISTDCFHQSATSSSSYRIIYLERTKP